MANHFLSGGKLALEELLYTLALDTSESRGSVAVLRSGEPAALKLHDDNSDYSQWLLAAAEELLHCADIRIEDLDLLAVATGPGSFTGLRVGLTTVKAWVEVYGKPVVGVSRLEAMAQSHRSETGSGFVAASYDAQRGQLFGALYRSSSGQLARVQDELVISPQDFLEWVAKHAQAQSVSWISLDPELLTSLPNWRIRTQYGDSMTSCAPDLSTAIGKLAEVRARVGAFSDPLALDANYVRRSDAEIFWKGR